MSIDTTADFTNAFTDFGATATLSGVSVTGIFDNTPALGLGVVNGSNPTFTLKTTSIDSDPRGETLIVDGTSYTVRDWSSNAGLTVLELEAA